MRIVVAALAMLLPLAAQSRTSAIQGLVTDASGRPVAGAVIEAVSVERGFRHEVVGGEDGYYRVVGLDSGRYWVTARRVGFAESARQEVLVTLEREARVAHRLEVAAQRESITVSSEAVAVDASLTTVTRLVDAERMAELPLNGRDYLQLAVLEPGVQVARAQSRDGNVGFGLPLSINGSRPVQNVLMLDGVSMTNHNGGLPGSLLGVSLGVEAMREFSVAQGNLSAVEGRSAGGILHAATKSGTNEGHGSVYYFHRNSATDARNYFDGAETAAFRRHQAGGALGGPLKRDRTFYFVNYEGVSEYRASRTLNTTLSEQGRAGQLKAGAVAVDAAAAQVAALYPLPNAGVLGDTGLFSFANPLNGTEQFVTARLDHRPGPRSAYFLRYTFDTAESHELTNFALARKENETRMHSLAAEYARTLTPALLATTRGGWLRSYSHIGQSEALQAGLLNAKLEFLPGAPGVGDIVVSGLSEFQGSSGGLDNDRGVYDSGQLLEDISYSRGRHQMRFGFRAELTRFDFTSATTPLGQYTFSTVADLLANRPLRYKAPMPGTDPQRLYQQGIFAWYVQDQWRLSRRVTLELGLRHEWITVPAEANGKVSNLDRLTDAQVRVGGAMFRNPSLRNFGPRGGVAWDARGDGRTLFRAAYGIYFDQILSPYLLIAGVRNPPFYLYADARNLPAGVFPGGAFAYLQSQPTIDLRAERLGPDVAQPYVQQWNASLEQTVAKGLVLDLAYAGSHGVNLSTMVEDANLVTPVKLADGRLYFPAGAPKLNANFGFIRDRQFNGHAFYHSLQTRVARRTGRGLVQVSHTWSKSIDDDSSTFARTDAANSIGIPVNGNARFNRGLSGFDVRQQVVAHGLWQLPKAGWLGAWRVGGLATAASGLPFSVTLGYDAARTGTSRPDYRGGQRPDLNPALTGSITTGDPVRWFRPEAFLRPEAGFLGNLGRNTLKGPGLFSADAVVERDFAVPRWERVQVNLRLEGFNLTNHANFDLPAASRTQVFSATGVPEDTGRITSAGPARKFQAGLRVRF